MSRSHPGKPQVVTMRVSKQATNVFLLVSVLLEYCDFAVLFLDINRKQSLCNPVSICLPKNSKK
jgi:hypothetical protein